MFAVAAALLLAGGPQHPGGTMAEMLHDPQWVPSHALMFGGFAALFVGLILLGRSGAITGGTKKWLRIAAAGTAFQAVEMAIHTAAAVDHANLVAGRPTPVLTTHLALSVLAHPLFAATTIGLMITGIRECSLGSPWIVWIGIIGAIGHGAAAPLVILTDVAWARLLFPLLVLLGAWLILVALWPLRARDETAAEATASSPVS